jgi:hypothetical protein
MFEVQRTGHQLYPAEKSSNFLTLLVHAGKNKTVASIGLATVFLFAS